MRRRKRRSDATRDERWLLGLTVSFVAVLGFLALWYSLAGEPGPTVVQAGTDLKLSLADLKPGELNLFTYPIDPLTDTGLVVQRGEDHILRVAFASCRSCYGLRHYDRFGQLICRRCGHAMHLPDPGEEPTDDTGCIPVAIPYSTEGEELIVRGQMIKEQFHRWYGPPSGTE